MGSIQIQRLQCSLGFQLPWPVPVRSGTWLSLGLKEELQGTQRVFECVVPQSLSPLLP